MWPQLFLADLWAIEELLEMVLRLITSGQILTLQNESLVKKEKDWHIQYE